MPRKIALLGIALLASASLARPGLAQPPAVGEPAPAFRLVDAAGAVHTLAERKGVQAVVLAWFPAAFTPG